VPPRHTTPPRQALTKERVLRAAVDVADREGLEAVTMRRLGAELGVQAMSLYKHVSSKDQILDEIVELVFGWIEVPGTETGWKEAMRRRARSARQILRQHTWAIGLLESRGTTGPASMRYVDSILGCLRSAGFSVRDAAHAFWTLDSFVYGHVLQEARMPAPEPREASDPSTPSPEQAGAFGYPHLAEMAGQAGTSQFSFDQEFDFGLDLIIDALERATAPSGTVRAESSSSSMDAIGT
jgi:AcrR family transcriptional regulator